MHLRHATIKAYRNADSVTEPVTCFVLRFYGPVNTILVLSSQPVNLSTLSLGRLTSTKCPTGDLSLSVAVMECLVD